MKGSFLTGFWVPKMVPKILQANRIFYVVFATLGQTVFAEKLALRKSRSDCAIVARICAAAHSTNTTAAAAAQCVEVSWTSAFLLSEGSHGRTFSSLHFFSIERRPARYDLHVSILQELVVHLLFS